jgi:hypothetical protein
MKRAMPSWIPLLSLVLLGGCIQTRGDADHRDTAKAKSFFGLGSREHLVAGTALRVRLLDQLSSETAEVGDTWSGVIEAPVVVDGDVVINTGTPVEGVVTASLPANRGSRALIETEVRKVTVHDRATTLRATTHPVIAGSPRARNLGAIAGGAAAGALVGKAAGGNGRAAGVGALVGGGVAGGVVAASSGYQVVLPEGSVMTFTVSQEVAMR